MAEPHIRDGEPDFGDSEGPLVAPSPKELEGRRPLAGLAAASASLWGALLLFAWDGVLSGSFVMSLLACPMWFVVSILKNLLQRPGWRIALFRIAIPALTLTIVLANSRLQSWIAITNAERIIIACRQFHAVKGRYPGKLDELVPQYLDWVPRTKYCLLGQFLYFAHDDFHMLVYTEVPPYSRHNYRFEEGTWRWMD